MFCVKEGRHNRGGHGEAGDILGGIIPVFHLYWDPQTDLGASLTLCTHHNIK